MQLHLKLSLYAKKVSLHIDLYINNTIFKEFDFNSEREGLSWAA